MTKNIIIADASYIVYEGLNSIISNSGITCKIRRVESIEEISNNCIMANVDVIFINPTVIINNNKAFTKLKTQYEKIKWVGIVYAYYDPKIIALFDETITIDASAAEIINIIKTTVTTEQQSNSKTTELLSDREIDVLKLLAMGMANKEIANKLNISTNTVITHRKNISAKIGIKSLSGLTIYAVTQKIITIEALS